jgi:Tfp pilus assembly protein PilN
MGGGGRRRDSHMLITGFNLSSIDYARMQRARRLLTGIAAVLLVVVAAQLVVWAVVRRSDAGIGGRLAAMQAELRQHQAALQAVKARIRPDAVKKAESAIGGYNRILDAAAFSWIDLLVELERSVPPGVILADIQPEPATGVVALHGSARNFEDISKLVSTLQAQPKFKDVFLRRQGEKKGPTGAAGRLDFSLNLVYQGRPS